MNSQHVRKGEGTKEGKDGEILKVTYNLLSFFHSNKHAHLTAACIKISRDTVKFVRICLKVLSIQNYICMFSRLPHIWLRKVSDIHSLHCTFPNIFELPPTSVDTHFAILTITRPLLLSFLPPPPFLTCCAILPTSFGDMGPHLRWWLVTQPSSKDS